MDSSKITIVTGEPRSGTSLMMQTLKLLGAPVTGKENPADVEKQIEQMSKQHEMTEVDKADIIRKSKHAIKMNPLGYYEIGGVVSRGISGYLAKLYLGKVVKIITSAIPHYETPNGMSSGTDKELIGKMILCLRDPKHIAVSQQDLTSSVEAVGPGGEFGPRFKKPNPIRYVQGTGHFLNWLVDNQDMMDKILPIEYEDMHADPTGSVQRVIDFLELSPTQEQVSAAVKNIVPSLRRSAQNFEWQKGTEKNGEIAEMIYKALQTRNFSSMIVAVTHVKEEMQRMSLESVMWLDDSEFGTWVSIGPEAYRLFLTNSDTLSMVKDNFDKREKARHFPTSCKYYTRNGKEYIIERPLDIGPLKRKKVFCLRDRDKKTIEECLTCWSRGWHRTEARKPEMELQGNI